MAPRLIRLPDSPVKYIAVTAASIESGIASATMTAARKLPSSNNRTAMTRKAPSARLWATVSRTRSIRSARL